MLLTKAKAKLIARRDALFVKVPVIDIEPFRKVVVAADHRGSVVRCLLGYGVRELAVG